MANVQTQSLTQMLQNFASAVQGSVTSAILNFNIGTVLRALGEAVSGIALWLQGLILQMMALTRASTSTGPDLDTWFADFGFARLGAASATGSVTFSRFTPTAQAVIPVGTVVQTTDGSQQFTVNLDTTNAAYSSTLGGYVLAPSVPSVTVTVTAVTPGSAANVLAGTISQMSQSVPGVDTVTNAAAFTNGIDAQSDANALASFQSWLLSLSKATKAAIGNAITSLQQNLTYTITENSTYAGVYQPGNFWVMVDDGSGAPSDNLISNVSNAIDAVRGFTITFDVHKPIVVSANISMTIATASGYTHSAVVALVQAALQSFISTLPRDPVTQTVTLPYSRLSQVAYDASPGVINVTGITLNSGTSDVVGTSQQVIRAGTLVVN
jgi:uncharacterized phage protein gp47/JayE